MRSLLSALALSLLALMVDVGAASSQQPGRVYKIGWLRAGEQGVAPVRHLKNSPGPPVSFATLYGTVVT